MSEFYRRFNQRSAVRMEDSDGDGKRITGYAAVFYRADDPGTEYRLWENAVERILPGAFDRMMSDGDDVRALFNHRSDYVLGRRSAGTLRLSVDEVGLKYEIEPADTTIYRDVAAHIERGDISGSSFAFMSVADQQWTETEDGTEIRSIRSFGEILDVGPVTFPAYESTTTAARDAIESRNQWQNVTNVSRLRIADLARLDRARIMRT